MIVIKGAWHKASHYMLSRLSAVGFLSAIGVGLLILVAAYLRVGFERERFLLNWAYTHYLFNYRDGFVKRGFIGELLRLCSVDITYPFLQKFTTVLLGIFCLMFVVYLAVVLVRSVNKYAGLLLILLLGMTSFSLQHFIFDIGRFDIVSYSLLLLLMAYFLKAKANLWLTLIVMSVFVLLVLLIHEANFFMVVPIALACWGIRYSDSTSRIWQVLMGLSALVLTYLISTYGAYTALDHDGHLQALREQYGSWVIRSSLRVIHDITLQDNIILTLWHTMNAKHLMHHIAFFVFSTPLFILLAVLFSTLKSLLGRQVWLLLLAAFAPLLIYPIGLDHFRWWSLSLFNFMLIVSFLSLLDSKVFNAVETILLQRQALVWFTVLLGLLTGPIRPTMSFTFVESILVNQLGF